VTPIIPVARREPFDDPAWIFEPKYDGFRGLVYATGSFCVIRSKRGRDFTRFDELCRQVHRGIPAREAILDGEVLAVDRSGLPNFHGLLAGEGPMAYVAFDLLWLDGRDLRDLPLIERKRRLTRLIGDQTGSVMRSFVVEACGRELFEAVCRLDLEGIVAKRKADPYEEQTRWYKVKNPTYTQAEGRRELFERRGGGK
jgi:bifunctional non-homologous end joining protein LigD